MAGATHRARLASRAGGRAQQQVFVTISPTMQGIETSLHIEPR